MRRPRLWAALGIAFLLIAAAVVVSLPVVFRWATVRQIEGLTGRRTTVANVDLNLFTRRLVVEDIRVAGRAAEPLLAVPRVEARFRLAPLLAGRVHLDRVDVAEPAVRVARLPDGSLGVEDVLERIRARPAGKPLAFVIEAGRLAGGRVVLDDAALSPPRRWQATGITLDVAGVGVGRRAGTATLRLDVVGAPVVVDVDRIAVRPARARATVTVGALDLSPIALYTPADAAVRPVGGRFSTEVRAEYDADAGLLAAADSTIRDLVMMRRGQAQPFVTTPALTIASRGVRYRDGAVTAERIEARGAPSVLDASVTPAQRHDLARVHLVAEHLSFPARAPGQVALTIADPAGGTLEARGGLTVYPVAADLTVRIANLDLARARPYLASGAPIRLAGGVGSGTLHLRYATPTGLGLSGDVTMERLVIAREGQREPFISHRRLRAAIADLRLRRGALTVGRATVSGAPVIVDARVSPPQRFDVAALELTVRDLAWPAGAPARVEGRARLAAGGAAVVEGTVAPGTLRTDLQARFRDVDVVRLAGYLPPGAPVQPAGGVARSDVRVRWARGAPLRLDATGVVRDAAVARRGEEQPLVTVPALELGVSGLAVDAGAATAERIALDGAPTLVVGGDSARTLSLPGLSLVARDVSWPGRDPAAVTLEARLPGSGTLTARGDVKLADRAADLTVTLTDAAVGPYAGLLGVAAPVDGRVRATFRLAADLDEAARVEATGRLAARDLVLGPPAQPTATIAHVELGGIRGRWPHGLDIAQAVITEPSLLVEREKDGSFPLRAMLAPRGEPRDGAPAGDGPVSALARPEEAREPLRLAIDEIRVVQGDARFIDRTTTPFYSEEITRLAVEVRGFGTAPDAVASLSVQGIVGADAALDLDGEVRPFGEPFVLDVAGELRDFSVPRTNPYLRRFLDWIARRGELTTRVRYRIEGRELTGSNDIVVERLDVAPAGRDPDRMVGLPLGLVVSLLKNPRGDIELSLPVSGNLGSPQFSFGDAIRTALRNVVSRLVMGPLQAIGRVVTGRRGEVEAVVVDPVVFAPGSAVVGPDAAKQVQRVGDLMRASPFVGLTLTPVVTDEDMLALKAQAVASRVQRLQREARLPDFASAVRTLFETRFPDRTPPETVDAMIVALRDAEPVAEEAARELASRRLLATRRALTEEAGIEAERLRLPEAGEAPPPGAPGDPRIEFALVPIG